MAQNIYMGKHWSWGRGCHLLRLKQIDAPTLERPLRIETLDVGTSMYKVERRLFFHGNCQIEHRAEPMRMREDILEHSESGIVQIVYHNFEIAAKFYPKKYTIAMQHYN